MRTAEEYLEEKFPNAAKLDWFIPISECINIARREAIEEAAKNARVIVEPGNGYAHVDYKSILSLINELK